MKFLTANWMTAPVGMIVYLISTVLFWQTPKPPPVALTGPVTSVSGPSWEFSNPEADQLVAELKAEKKTLQLREQQLAEMESRVQSERSELSQVTQSVRNLQTDFDKSVMRVQADEMANLKKLAKVYADMSPDSAAAIFAQMDDAAVVKIMVFMKDGETAGILEAFSKKSANDSKRAALISERLRLASAKPVTPPTK